MSRAPFTFTAIRTDDDDSGKNVVPFATVTGVDSAGAPAQLYNAQTGGTAFSSFTLDANGEKTVWAEPGLYSFSIAGGPYRPQWISSYTTEDFTTAEKTKLTRALSVLGSGEYPPFPGAVEREFTYLFFGSGGAPAIRNRRQVLASVADASDDDEDSKALANTIVLNGVVKDPANIRSALNVANGATANATDAQLRDRSTHTGTQSMGTIDGLSNALSAKLDKSAVKPDLTSPNNADAPSTLAVASAINSVMSGSTPKGAWDAENNIPALASNVGNAGDWYEVSVPGTTNLNGNNNWDIGDRAIFNGLIWTRVPANSVRSVDGMTGSVILNYSTVADLSAALQSIPIGSVVSTKGCLIEGDGGHGTFDKVESTDLDVDGYSVIGNEDDGYLILRPQNGVYHVLCFGAKAGDPDFDDNHLAFGRAIARANTKVVFACNEPYTVKQTCLIQKSGVELDLTGAEFDATGLDTAWVGNQPDSVFEVRGSVRGSTTLASAAAKDATSITVASVANIAIGDLVTIQSSSELWYTESGTAVSKRFVTRISKIDGANVQLQHALPFEFSVTGFTVTVTSYNTLKGFIAYGGKFYGGGVRKNPTGNGTGTAVFWCRYVDSPVIGGNGMYMEGFQNMGVRTDFCAEPETKDIIIRGFADDFPRENIVEGQNSGFYGVFHATALCPKWTNLVGIRTRHLQDSANSWYGTVVNCIAINNHRPGLGVHLGCGDFLYDNNESIDGNGGFQWRGHSFTWNGGRIHCPNYASAGMYGAVGGANDIPSKISINNPTINCERHGINFVATVGVANVSGGVITVKDASYAGVQVDSLYCGLVNINNVDITVAGSNAIFTANNSPVTRGGYMVSNCIIRGYTSSAVRVFGVSGGGETDVIVKDCYFFPEPGATVHVNGANIRNFVRTPNYLSDGTVYNPS